VADGMRDTTLLSGQLTLAGRLDARFFALLQGIADTGSINKAARVAGYSYKGAWLVLEAAAQLADAPLVDRATGGRQGGGSRLTEAAQGLLDCWRQLQAAHDDFLRTQDHWLMQQPALAGTLRSIAMKTTARNQFAGVIDAVDVGPVSAQASVRLPGGQSITATMTAAAAARLRLQVGQQAIALVKSSAVVLVTDFAGFELSARNQLAGTISRIERGAVSSLVGLTLPGGAAVTASVTNDAVAALALAVGQPATAVFKAYSVMLAVLAR
jgi:molybdate transport system regulatory protein